MNWPRVEDGEVRVSIDPDIAGWYSSLVKPHERVYYEMKWSVIEHIQ